MNREHSIGLAYSFRGHALVMLMRAELVAQVDQARFRYGKKKHDLPTSPCYRSSVRKATDTKRTFLFWGLFKPLLVSIHAKISAKGVEQAV